MGRAKTAKRPPILDQTVSDMPAIRLKAGRFLLELGLDTWQVKWDEVYRYIVLHWEMSRGIMINLESKASGNPALGCSYVAFIPIWRRSEFTFGG